MANTFTAASLKRTNAALRTAQLKVAATAPKAEGLGATEVAKQMAARAPARTGRLRASIRADGSSAVAQVPYAIPVDRGTVNMAAQPFAEDGAQAAVPAVAATMAAAFKAALGG